MNKIMSLSIALALVSATGAQGAVFKCAPYGREGFDFNTANPSSIDVKYPDERFGNISIHCGFVSNANGSNRKPYCGLLDKTTNQDLGTVTFGDDTNFVNLMIPYKNEGLTLGCRAVD